MKMIIIGNKQHFEDCVECVSQCKLGEAYFADPDHVSHFFMDGFEKAEIYIYSTSQGNVAGMMRIDPVGSFARFPLLRLVAIKPAFRGNGIGNKMLEFYEKEFMSRAGKLFLFVSEFNTGARKLYNKLGYTQVGAIPGLYKDGITEFLMMKKQ